MAKKICKKRCAGSLRRTVFDSITIREPQNKKGLRCKPLWLSFSV